MATFIDTSALYALLDADDENHARSAVVWQKLIESDERIFTTNYILVETFALTQSRLGIEAARELQENLVPVFSVEYVNTEIHRLGIATLFGALKRRLSLVDCISFEVMRNLGIKTAFTFDSHFRQYGFLPIP